MRMVWVQVNLLLPTSGSTHKSMTVQIFCSCKLLKFKKGAFSIGGECAFFSRLGIQPGAGCVEGQTHIKTQMNTTRLTIPREADERKNSGNKKNNYI